MSSSSNFGNGAKKSRYLVWKVLFLIFLAVGSVYIIAHNREMTLHEDSGDIFGTSYHIKYRSRVSYADSLLAVMKEVDASLSIFNPESTVSLINQNRSRHTDALFRDVFQLSQRVSDDTGGAFDCTVGPLVNAWGFGFKKGMFPTQQHVDSLLAYVGFSKVRLEKDGNISKADSNVVLDFGAVAKGYAVDRVANYLLAHGVKDYIIEIGGEVVAHGQKGVGEKWTVGIRYPSSNPDDDDIQGVFKTDNVALATSGNYLNYYEKDGKKYAHTIDPRLGVPVQHSLLSASVIAPDCATADSYATAFMVVGMDEAKKILARHTDISAFFIYADDKGVVSTWHDSRWPAMSEK